MMNELNHSQIEKWDYLDSTPSGGRLMFSPEFDMCAVVYKNKTKVFYARNQEGFTPHCFNNMKEIIND